MFLKMAGRLLLAREFHERGAAMVAVLGLMGMAGIVGITTTTMSIHALGYTTSTRAGVQAEAAAEAGIDFAAANLATSPCQAQYSRTSTPVFSVSVSYSPLATSSGNTDSSWVNGCPNLASAARIKLVSQGSASTLGAAGHSSQNIRTVEAIFNYLSPPPPNSITPSGPALYSFAQVDPTINNLTLIQGGSIRPSIQFLTGSATCTSGTTIIGDVILGAGSLSVTSGCTINGDLWTTGGVSIQSGEVTGNLNSLGMQNGTSLTLATPAIVDGNVYAAGPVAISGKVGGSIVSGPAGGLSTLSNKASVGGSFVTAGTVSAPVGAIKGTTTINKMGITPPTMPFVPPWVDYAYSPNDWKNSDGTAYALNILTSCGTANLSSALNTLQNSAVAMILDTRICGPVTNLSGYNLTLKSDAVIITNGFQLSSNTFNSSDLTNKRLWFITPDSVADSQPTCPPGSSAKITNHVLVGPQVGAMIYSPCAISNAGDAWRGQMYSSSIGSSASFTLNYLPIGLPTVNLSTGQFLPSSGVGVMGNRISIRD